MNKLTEGFKNIIEKLKNLSRGKKIALGVLSATVIVLIVYIAIWANTTNYAVLFSDMDPKDSGAVIEKLKEKKVEYKVEKESILVPKEVADSLRMEMISQVNLTSGSTGWELFDKDSMVATEFENNINYRRALEGTIERSIKTFEEIKYCKVNLAIPQKSLLAREKDPASAAVVIMLEDGVKEITDGQVKTIVALITGSVENLPRENVKIAVDGMKLVTEDLFDENKDKTISTDEQENIRREREKDYERKILNVLREAFGSGVKAAVNLDMNFDQKSTETIDYEEGVIVSEHSIISSNKDDGSISSNPIDNNMNNVIDEGNNGRTTNKSETTKNYNVPEKKEVHVEALGKINKMTVAILVDESLGALDDETKNNIKNIAANAVGFNAVRGDGISVASMNFIDSTSSLIDNTTKEMEKEIQAEKRDNLVRDITYAIGALVLLITVLSILKRLKKNNSEIDKLEEVMNEEITHKELEFSPLDLDGESEHMHLAGEVKKYASEKPEQVADIIKSWLAEDER